MLGNADMAGLSVTCARVRDFVEQVDGDKISLLIKWSMVPVPAHQVYQRLKPLFQSGILKKSPGVTPGVTI